MGIEEFSTRDMVVDGAVIRVREGGSGPPLLLLHGHPQTHAMWHRVAPDLARDYRVVMADLRGYGDSSRPAPGERSAAYAKRVMARDMVQVMDQLGHDRFRLGAHDRGARVAHRLALDYPDRVSRLVLLDIAPTLAMYSQTTEAFARAYWHWFFLIQPAPLPERLIDADPVAYIQEVMGRRHAGLSVFAPEALAEYRRCIALPGTSAGICGDYRASAGIDLDHDRADLAAGRRLSMPVHVLWSAQGTVGQCFDVLAEWRRVADDVTGEPLECGHYLAEEQPEQVIAAMRKVFAGAD